MSNLSCECNDCGARYQDPQDSCARRFDKLLALDHSQREPWGSRHGLAFSAYALQHPSAFPASVLDQSWKILYRVYVAADDAARVLQALRGRPSSVSANWEVPLRPEAPAGYPATNIAHLGDFAAAEYAAMLESWARATVEWLIGKSGSSH